VQKWMRDKRSLYDFLIIDTSFKDREMPSYEWIVCQKGGVRTKAIRSAVGLNGRVLPHLLES
jgi:hypothetical protein